MKILVIDNSEDITAHLLAIDVEVECCVDEIMGLNAAEKQQSELILLSYALLREQTPDYIRLLVNVAPGVSLVVVGQNTEDEEVFRCLLAGAKGYLESQSLPGYFDRMIRAISQGEAWVSRRMVARLLDAIREMSR